MNSKAIQPATAANFDFVYQLYMHPAINPFLLYEPMEPKEFEPIFEGLIKSGVKFIYYDNGEAVGMFKLIPLAHRNTHIAYLGGVAVHPQFGGKGYGLQMLEAILAFAKQRGFLRVELSVADTNEKAIRLYEKVGFKKEGLLKNYTLLQKENRFVDEVMMGYLVS